MLTSCCFVRKNTEHCILLWYLQHGILSFFNSIGSHFAEFASSSASAGYLAREWLQLSSVGYPNSGMAANVWSAFGGNYKHVGCCARKPHHHRLMEALWWQPTATTTKTDRRLQSQQRWSSSAPLEANSIRPSIGHESCRTSGLAKRTGIDSDRDQGLAGTSTDRLIGCSCVETS